MSIISCLRMRLPVLLSVGLSLSLCTTSHASPINDAKSERTKSVNKSLVKAAASREESKRREALEIAKSEYQSGLVDFKAERYRDALQRFVRVYRINPHPNLVYNMARSFEQLKEYQNAADYYRKYLDLSPKAKDREQVEMTITTMKRLAQDSSVESQERERQLLRRVGWGSAALGGALMIGGSLFGVRALNRSEELGRFQAGDSLQDFNSVASQRDEAALFSDLFMVSGVAIASLGLYFALRPSLKSETSQRAEIDLSLSPQGITIQGAF